MHFSLLPQISNHLQSMWTINNRSHSLCLIGKFIGKTTNCQ